MDLSSVRKELQLLRDNIKILYEVVGQHSLELDFDATAIATVRAHWW